MVTRTFFRIYLLFKYIYFIVRIELLKNQFAMMTTTMIMIIIKIEWIQKKNNNLQTQYNKTKFEPRNSFVYVGVFFLLVFFFSSANMFMINESEKMMKMDKKNAQTCFVIWFESFSNDWTHMPNLLNWTNEAN